MNSSITTRLLRSKIFTDYQKAFTSATGLPLKLVADCSEGKDDLNSGGNKFCSMMSSKDSSCAACHELHQKLREGSPVETKTMKCFAGLCETAIPVQVGDRVVSFLRTGQVLTDDPSKKKFNKIARSLLEWGVDVDLKKLEEQYYHLRVLSPEQYLSTVELLRIFSKHLSFSADSLVVDEKTQQNPAIERARKFIQDHSDDDLFLDDVSKVVNMSATYFCEMFKKCTGYNFSDYVARIRIEKAKNLLRNSDLRISEVAFKVGFSSLPHFNRVFRKLVTRSPRDYRTQTRPTIQ